MFSNPYANTGNRWLRGEIHAHVNKARGHEHVYAHGMHAYQIYEHASAAGLDFVCMSVEVLSKHGVNRFGDVGEGRVRNVRGIPAREIQNNYYSGYFKQADAKYLHVLTLGEDDGVSLCVHPTYYETASPRARGQWWRIRRALYGAAAGEGRLGRLGVCGIEIYNAFSFMRFLDEGRRVAYEEFEEECWDDMLTRGCLYWGFVGGDSFYSPEYEFRDLPYRGLVHADVREGCEQADILAALREGRFYSSTGIELAPEPLRATVQGGNLVLEATATERVDWTCHVHRNGALQREVVGPRKVAKFTISEPFRYVRVSCRHPRNRWKRAWLQPLTNDRYFGQ